MFIYIHTYNQIFVHTDMLYTLDKLSKFAFIGISETICTPTIEICRHMCRLGKCQP